MRRSSLRKALLLALIFVFPFWGAHFLIQHPHWLPHQSKAHGILHSPPPTLQAFSTQKSPHWQLVFWTQLPCENTCLQALHDLRQIKRALGPLHQEVQSVFWGNPSVLQKKKLTTLDPELTFLNTQNTPLSLKLTTQQNAPLKEALLIVDPKGHLVLHYPLQLKSARFLLKDIRYLLKVKRL